MAGDGDGGCRYGAKRMDALRIAEEKQPDLVLCDIRMPVMDGLTFIGKLREMGLDSEVLLLTGYQEFDYAREAIRLGVKEYICKPIHYEELGNKVREIGAKIRSKQFKNKLYNSIQFFRKSLKVMMILAKKHRIS